MTDAPSPPRVFARELSPSSESLCPEETLPSYRVSKPRALSSGAHVASWALSRGLFYSLVEEKVKSGIPAHEGSGSKSHAGR